jgi:hypothetical protein
MQWIETNVSRQETEIPKEGDDFARSTEHHSFVAEFATKFLLSLSAFRRMDHE